MAFLVPDKIYTANGVTVKQRIIPFGVKCSKDIYEGGKISLHKGDKFKADRYLLTDNHIPEYITVHNTDDIREATGTTKSEQYSRATYPNQNMGTCRIHYYVCPVEIWQNLLDTEIGWHVSYSKNPIANNKSISIEIIGNYEKSEDNGARLVAYLLKKYNLPIDRVRTHNSWSGKNCPCWILPHWDKFIEKVKFYLNGGQKPVQPVTPKITPINNIMKSLGTAAIRTAPSKSGDIKGRVTKGGYYAFDEMITLPNGEVWLRHFGTKLCSMLIDGQTLFSTTTTYSIKYTTNTLNVRSKPSLSGDKMTVLKQGEKVFVFDGYSTKQDGYTWVKILVGDKVGYVASKYLR